jgi:hypothetical protein
MPGMDRPCFQHTRCFQRTNAEALVNNFGATESKIAGPDLQEFSTEDREMIMETLTSLKNTLEGGLAGASDPGKNSHENDRHLRSIINNII